MGPPRPAPPRAGPDRVPAGQCPCCGRAALSGPPRLQLSVDSHRESDADAPSVKMGGAGGVLKALCTQPPKGI